MSMLCTLTCISDTRQCYTCCPNWGGLGLWLPRYRTSRSFLPLQRCVKPENCTGTQLQWESPLTLKSIVKYPSPILRAPNAQVGVFGEPLKKLAAEMLDVMYLCGAPSAACACSLTLLSCHGSCTRKSKFASSGTLPRGTASALSGYNKATRSSSR
jgi:hypothetical protein